MIAKGGRYVALLCLAWWVLAGFSASEGSTVVLKGLQGKEVSVELAKNGTVEFSSINAQVILVNFWATWCTYCKKEVPELAELYREYKDRGLTVIGISLDPRGAKVVKPFIKKYQVDYPILLGNKKIVREWKIRGLPMSFLIDGKGKIRQVYIGPRNKSIFEQDILALLKSRTLEQKKDNEGF